MATFAVLTDCWPADHVFRRFMSCIHSVYVDYWSSYGSLWLPCTRPMLWTSFFRNWLQTYQYIFIPNNWFCTSFLFSGEFYLFYGFLSLNIINHRISYVYWYFIYSFILDSLCHHWWLINNPNSIIILSYIFMLFFGLRVFDEVHSQEIHGYHTSTSLKINSFDSKIKYIPH